MTVNDSTRCLLAYKEQCNITPLFESPSTWHVWKRAWRAATNPPDEKEVSESAKKLKDLIVKEYKEGYVIVADFNGLSKIKMSDLLEQPLDGILYDINRNEATIMTFLPDLKWINDYASMAIIKELYERANKKDLTDKP